MIICICKSLNEDTLRELLKEGLEISEILELTGAASECGSCLEAVREILEE
jgi:bacterioferritin-associated ferredoxin